MLLCTQTKPWTIRQYSGFSTAKDSNAFYKKNILRVKLVFQLPLICQHIEDMVQIMKEIKGDVGMAGVAMNTIDDINELFEGIDLNNIISVSMTMNGAVASNNGILHRLCQRKWG